MKSRKKNSPQKIEIDHVRFYFLWNPGNLSEELKRNYYGVAILESEEQLAKADLTKAKGLIILAELNWQNQKLSNFYGIEILKRLRVERRITLPVLLLSFMPSNYFYFSQNKDQFEILKSPGLTLKQLPFNFNPESIKKELPNEIDDETLEDTVETLCDLDGMLNEKLHRVKNSIIITSQESKITKDEIRNKFDKIIESSFVEISRLLTNDLKVDKIKKDLLTDIEAKVISTGNYANAVEVVNSYIGILQLLLPSKSGESSGVVQQKPPWKVLFVDDEEHIRNRVEGEFKKRNIVCEIAGSAEEVFTILDADATANKITALIADYRLCLPGSEKWQDIQGYGILKHVFLHKPNLLAFFALTAAHRRALLRIQRNYSMKVFPYTKEDVLSSDGAFNIFAQKVSEEAEKVFDAVCSQPQLTSWHQKGQKNALPLKEYYRVHRQSIDYDEGEKQINEEAKNYVENVVFISKKTSYDDPTGHKFNFQADLSADCNDMRIIKKFRERLIGRRIAIGLHVILGLTRNGVFYAMRKNPTLKPDTIEVKKRPGENSIKALLNTALAFSFDDFPDHLLVEERGWLMNTMNIDIDQSNKEAYQLLEWALEEFQEDLRDNESADEFVKMTIKITNLEIANKITNMAFTIAEKTETKEKLRTRLTDCIEEAQNNPVLERAFRMSGLGYYFSKLNIIPADNKILMDEYHIGKINTGQDEDY